MPMKLSAMVEPNTLLLADGTSIYYELFGVPSGDRLFISEMLNSTFDYEWVVDANSGAVTVRRPERQRAQHDSEAFEALSKQLDAYELGELVRMRMGDWKERARERKREEMRRLRSRL